MSDIKFETVEEKASYGIGLQMGQQLAGSGLDGLNVAAIAAGIATSLTGDMPAIEVDEINKALHELYTRAESARAEAAKAAAADGEVFLKDNALRPEVTALSLACNTKSSPKVMAKSQRQTKPYVFTTMANWLTAPFSIAQYHVANQRNSQSQV